MTPDHSASNGPQLISSAAWPMGSASMGAPIQTAQWSEFPAGPPDTWPLRVRHAVEMILASPVPMAVIWGDQKAIIGNHAYHQLQIAASNIVSPSAESTARSQPSRHWVYGIFQSVSWGAHSAQIDQAFFQATQGIASLVTIPNRFHTCSAAPLECNGTHSFSPLTDEHSEVDLPLNHPVLHCITTAQFLVQTENSPDTSYGYRTCTVIPPGSVDTPTLAIPADLAGSAIIAHHDTASTQLRKARIIYAVDPADVSKFIIDLPADEYDIEIVASGESVLTSSIASPPDLLLLDESMSGLDVIELLMALRTDSRTNTIAILLMCTNADPLSKADAINAGADDLLEKPINQKELYSRIKSAVDLVKFKIASHEAIQSIEKASLVYANETRFQATFELAAVGIAHVSINGAWLRVNKKLCEIFGYSQEELIRLRFQDLTVAEDLSADLALVEEALEGKRSQYTIEKRYYRKSGEVFWGNLTVSLVRKKNGMPNYFISVVEDIQSRKIAELALHRSRAELQAIVDNISEGLIIFDELANPIYWNPAAISLHGFKNREEIPLSAQQFGEQFEFHTLSGQQLRFNDWPLNRISRGESLRDLPLRLHCRTDNWERIFRFSGSQVKDNEGTVFLSLITITDVTKELATEQQLRSSESRLQLITNQIPALISYVDTQCKYHFANQRYFEWFGIEPKSMIGQSIQDILGIDALHQIQPHLDTVFKGQVVSYEMEITYKHSGRHMIHADYIPDIDQDGKVLGFFAMITDISKRWRTENEIRQLNAELEARVENRTSELISANRELESFSYAVAHDLRAPLRHIAGFSQLLSRSTSGQLDENAQGLLQRIIKASTRMGQMIDELLAFSRMGRTMIKLDVIDLRLMIETAIANQEPEIGNRHIQWELPEALELRGDSSMIEMVLNNLISNAIKFTSKREHARIQIHGEADGDSITVSIADNGAGFDMRYADQLFGVFHRLHTSDEFPGTGIGLATVRRIITRHGGKTWAYGFPDQGATFYFTLPNRPTLHPTEAIEKTDPHGGQN